MIHKVILAGNSGSGKTTVCRRLMGMPLNYASHPNDPVEYFVNDKIAPTLGVEVHPYHALGGRTYNLWDTAGNPQRIGLAGGYYVGGTMALIFDGGEFYKSIQEWTDDIKRVLPHAPIYVVEGTLEQKFAAVNNLLV